MSLDEKLKKLDLLTKLHTSMSKTCVELYQDGQDALAAQLEEINLHLAMAIEELTHKSLEEWIALSKSFVSKVEPDLKSIENSLSEINKSLKNSKKISKNVSQIDKALKAVLKQVT